jgi:subtilisin family serine protease
MATSLLAPEYSETLARRLLIVTAVVLTAAAPARADLVQLKPDRGAALARRAGGTELVRELRIWRVPPAGVARLSAAGVVQLSEPEHVLLDTAAAAVATDPLVPTEWWRAVIGADVVDPPGPGKPVTVVDSGLDITHPEFANRPNTILLNKQTTTDEEEDHGTEVSSVLAAPNNGVGIVGVYPEAVLRAWDASPFGILNEGAAIQGIVEAARDGPGVINLSFGGEDDDPLLQDAVMLAYRLGSLVVAAAGNEGQEGSPKGYPAAYPHVLTVGATNDSGRVASFSTIGPTVDLVAPGVDMSVAEPLALDPSGYLLHEPGTSFSAPLVSGAAAWVWTVRPDLDNTQLFELMRSSATDIGPPGFDPASGYGLLNIPRALAFRTPRRDPQEPNDQPNEIEPHGLFPSGTPPLTRPGRPRASLTASVDRSEDPVDLYRAWAPAHETLRARVTGSVAVRVLPRASRTKEAVPLAVGKRGKAAYRNASAHGSYVYIEVRPAGVRAADYTLRLTAARR